MNIGDIITDLSQYKTTLINDIKSGNSSSSFTGYKYYQTGDILTFYLDFSVFFGLIGAKSSDAGKFSVYIDDVFIVQINQSGSSTANVLSYYKEITGMHKIKIVVDSSYVYLKCVFVDNQTVFGFENIIFNRINNFYTKTQVDTMLSNVNVGSINLTEYVKISDILALLNNYQKVEDIVNEHTNLVKKEELSEYLKKSEINQQGNVLLYQNNDEIVMKLSAIAEILLVR